MKKVLFVAYGSGHVRMVVPVAEALARQGLARVQILALTTAEPIARAAGLEVLQFKDFVTEADAGALEHGRRLMAEMRGPLSDPVETVAYLGLSYAELVEDAGVEAAAQLYRRDGRQAFLPVRTLRRIVAKLAPQLVVATNSPRAERAAIVAARSLGLPSVCLVDLFCLDEVKWIGAPDYADCICVLNESVRQFLVSVGRDPAQVVVTGNPAFDDLRNPAREMAGRALRERLWWRGKHVLLWPTQVEPAYHPFNGKPGDTELPGKVLAAVMTWVLSRDDAVLCIRPRAGEIAPALPDDPRVVLTGQDVSLPDLLHAVDIVVTLNSTVGLEGHFVGARLVQVLGSVFDDAMPLLDYGIADAAVTIEGLTAALDLCIGLPRRSSSEHSGHARDAVLEVISRFL